MTCGVGTTGSEAAAGSGLAQIGTCHLGWAWTVPQLHVVQAPSLSCCYTCPGLLIKCLLRGLLDSNPSMTRRITLDNTAITVRLEKRVKKVGALPC